MAKKKQENPVGALFAMLVGLVGVILFLISCLAIIALIVAWFYFEYAAKQYKGVVGRSDFKLGAAEAKALNDFQKAKTRIESRLSDISKLRHTQPLRNDGSFDNRNKEGKALNAELQTLRAELEQCDRTIDDLSSREEAEFHHWAGIKSGLYAARGGMLALPVIGAALFVKTPAIAQKLSAAIERQTGLMPIPNMDSAYGILVVSAGASAVVFLILWGVGFWAALKDDAGQ